MRRIRLYYKIKPLLPFRLRMTARRLAAKRTRRLAEKTWPIHPESAVPPNGWPGWPEGKKFAFVVTHDVERREGLANCPHLIKMEMAAGIRSSYNFVPEGDYRVPKELREQLAKDGFEVGIHDLHHDGKLYESREVFAQKAARINEYVREWGAKGFRSAFMHHNLEWLHDLNVQYDASTFDVDPFEPQPDGAHTIFPFWVSRATKGAGVSDTRHLKPKGLNGKAAGYYELPYTLTQDSTMFFVLGEKSIEVWQKKLDWVAEQGGMALINVHPDYMAFDGNKPTHKEYPAEHFKNLLDYVNARYHGKFWNPLPTELCDYLSRS